MKRFFLILLLIFSFFIQTYWYNISNFEEKREYYRTKLEIKVYEKINTFSDIKLDKLDNLIDKYIKRYENIDIKEELKLKKIALLYALKDIVKKIKEERLTINEDSLEIKIIDDNRCLTCNTDEIISSLKDVSYLKWSTFKRFDFKDKDVEDYLKYNNITKLPAIILPTNEINDNWAMKPYLVKIKSWEYLLNIGSTFNPFLERSSKWYLIVDNDIIKDIKENSYIKWNNNSKITWIEYSDIECPFCKKFHNDKIVEELLDEYKWKINYIFQHFPLEFHKNAKIASEVLECSWKQLWSEQFYDLIDKFYSLDNLSLESLFKEAMSLWANEEELDKCYKNASFSKKIDKYMKIWIDIFSITGTPWNVIINNDTKEYIIIPWAYSKEYFKEIIDKLLN